jgi:hypothetical protein
LSSSEGATERQVRVAGVLSDHQTNKVNGGLRVVFFRPDGASLVFRELTHGLRRGLQSCAASRLDGDQLDFRSYN